MLSDKKKSILVKKTCCGTSFNYRASQRSRRGKPSGEWWRPRAQRTSRQLLFYSNETAKKSPGRTGGPYRSHAAIGRPVSVVATTAAADAVIVVVAVAGNIGCHRGSRLVSGGRDTVEGVRRQWQRPRCASRSPRPRSISRSIVSYLSRPPHQPEHRSSRLAARPSCN